MACKFCKFHRVVRDVKLSIGRSSGAIFLKAFQRDIEQCIGVLWRFRVGNAGVAPHCPRHAQVGELLIFPLLRQWSIQIFSGL